MMQVRKEIIALAKVVNRLHPTNTLEIGIGRGGTFSLWGHLSERATAIDLPGGNFGGMPAELTLSRNVFLCREHPNTTIYSIDSHHPLAPTLLRNEMVDFLFIDGDHTARGVAYDYDVFSPFVRSGGLIAFHDIVDSPRQRAVGCDVCDFWQSLSGNKTEILAGEDWAGIGLLWKE